MKILILSCNTGEGHNSAARSIYKAFKEYGDECEVVDALLFSGKRNTTLVTTSFNSIIKRAPKVFGVAYEFSGFLSNTKITSPVYFANALYAKNLYRYIMEKEFDVVICTHLFSMESMTYILRKYPIAAKCYGVLTDYTCVPFLEETDLHGYFLPHKDLMRECVHRGMNKSKLFPTGIPVDPKFNIPINKKEARKHLNFSQTKKMYLIMTGGLGYGKVAKLCSKILKDHKEDIYINIIVGKNKKLKETIDRIYYHDPRVQTIDFTEKVNIYMAAADVLLSKPGGISSTEAAVIQVPLVHTLAIPGCETKNRRFFAQRGMSMDGDTLDRAAYFAKVLTDNKNIAENMLTMQRKNINPNASYDIVHYIKDSYSINFKDSII